MAVESWRIHAAFISHPLYLGHIEYGGRQVRTLRRARAWSGPWWRCLLDTSGHCTNEWRTAVATYTRGRQHHDNQHFSINAGVLMMIPLSSETVGSWRWLGERESVFSGVWPVVGHIQWMALLSYCGDNTNWTHCAIYKQEEGMIF